MQVRTWLVAILTLAAASAAASAAPQSTSPAEAKPSAAAEAKPAPAAQATATVKVAAPADRSAAEQEAFDAYLKLNRPGEPHRMLASMAGPWNLEVRSWTAPDTPPRIEHITATRTMILDGRYLREELAGTMMNTPFQGVSLLGYDNVKQKFVSAWMDNVTTGIFVTEGSYDPATKVLTMSGMMWDAVKQKDMPVRTVSRNLGGSPEQLEWYVPGPDGKDMKTLEIVYSRKP